MGIGTAILSIVAILLAIALVSALAFVFIYMLKLWQDRSLRTGEGGIGGRSGAPPMRFIRALPLGASERAVLVEVGDEILLLGVAGGGVTLLKSWPNDALPTSSSDERGDTFADDIANKVAPLAARFRKIPRLGRGDRA